MAFFDFPLEQLQTYLPPRDELAGSRCHPVVRGGWQPGEREVRRPAHCRYREAAGPLRRGGRRDAHDGHRACSSRAEDDAHAEEHQDREEEVVPVEPTMSGVRVQVGSPTLVVLGRMDRGDIGGHPPEHVRPAEAAVGAVRIVLDSLEVKKLTCEHGQCDLEFTFSLRAGGYATSVLREFRKTDDEGVKPSSMSGIESSDPNPETHA